MTTEPEGQKHPGRQAGSPNDGRQFYPELTVPDGLTMDDLRKAAQIIYDAQFEEIGDLEIAVRVWEFLAAAVEVNSEKCSGE